MKKVESEVEHVRTLRFTHQNRGQGLTPARPQKIQEWEAQVRESGASIDDVAALERILKRAIILRDIAGEVIYNSGKHQSDHIELIIHNGHAWGKDLHFPLCREVHIYEGGVLDAIREATWDKPMAVWLLGGSSWERKLTVDQFVLQDGRTYRPSSVHKGIQEVCKNLADVVSLEGNDLGYEASFAQRCFGENHAASVVAMKKNG